MIIKLNLFHHEFFFYRHFSTVSVNTKKIQRQKLNVEHIPHKLSKQAIEISNYYSKSQFFQKNLNRINSKYLDRRAYSSDKLIVADELVAKEIVEVIKNDLINKSEPVFEANPGLGLLTRELLNLDLPKVCVFETEASFNKCMAELHNDHHDRLKMYGTNILELWKITFLDKIDKGGRLKGIMEDVVMKDWEDDPCIRIIGALPTSSFIRSIIQSIVFEHGITTYGRPELFVLISPHQYSRIIKPSQGVDILFNIFFSWKNLLEVDYRALLPWISQKPSKVKKLINCGLDPYKYYLLKIVPKKDLYKIISPELMKPLWYFSRHIIRGRRLRVIPSLEKWIPGCGPRLIIKGIGTFTEYCELSPDEVLQVFLDFVSWPEFSSSSFISSLEDYLMKVVGSEEAVPSDSVTADSSSDIISEQQIISHSEH